MTKKKRELIEILLDNVKPEDWPESLPYAAQDKSKEIYFYPAEPNASDKLWVNPYEFIHTDEPLFLADSLCKHWNKTIVKRDEFVKRWNESNSQGVKKTPQQLALEKFGTDWHENDGVQPDLENVFVDIRLSRTGVYEQTMASKWSWELSQSNFIEEWRIHSETNATTPPAQQEVRIEETKPIQQELKAAATQIGGDHYTKLAIQPMRYSMENGLDALQHTVIKYVTRFRDKAGIEDLEKAKHCIDMLIEYEKESK